MSSKVYSLRSKYASAKRFRPSEDHSALRQDLKAAVIEQFLHEQLESGPVLRPEQLEALATLLTGGGQR